MNPRRSAGRKIRRALLRPFAEFAKLQASGSILLILGAIIAMIWANSQWSDSYVSLWKTYFSVGTETEKISMSLGHWVNDLLMAIFFLLVGLEIKREFLVGELASLKRATLPIAAAIGGMIVPALIYFTMNPTGETARGWAIPMATDIAFSLGVLALLGSKAPTSLKVFLSALAIVDDIGAVLVIAIFYTSQINMGALIFAGSVFGVLVLFNWLGVRNLVYYLVAGFILWVAILNSGLHATIAGVLLAFSIPAWVKLDAPGFISNSQQILKKIERVENAHPDTRLSENGQHMIHDLEQACENVQMPLQRLEHMLHPLVTYAVVPIFALANAGLILPPNFLDALTNPIALGSGLGLVFGKFFGIVIFSFLAVKFKWAELPVGIRWRQIIGVSLVAGIGFTMSLFIATLAFGEGPNLDLAKVGVFVGSIIAGTLGAILLSATSKPKPELSSSNSV